MKRFVLARGQVLKVMIHGEDDPLLTKTSPHDVFVRRLLPKIANPHHIVAFLGKEFRHPPAHVDIHDEFQRFSSFAAMATGNTSSSATKRRA